MAAKRASRQRPRPHAQLEPSRPVAAVPSASGITLAWRAGLIVLAGLLVYANATSGPFIFDDELSVVRNEQIREWWNVGQVLEPRRELPVAGRPIVNLSFALNYGMSGLEVRGYHAVNLALHLACALVLFGLVRRTLATPRLATAFGHQADDLALAVTLIWVVHPLNSEVVDYVTERTESMMALAYLFTMYACLRAVPSRGWIWSLAAVGACGLGMACKESMVTAPVMVLLYDWTFIFESMRKAFAARWRLYLGLIATWLILAALLSTGPRSYSAGFRTGVSPWTYLLNQAPMILRYVRLTFWPSSLVLFYGPPKAMTLGAALPSALLLAALIAWTVVLLVRRSALGFLGAWFFLTLAPTSSIVPIATEAGAERRMYLPLAGLIVLVVAAASRAWTRFAGDELGGAAPRRHETLVGWGLVVSIAVALGGRTVLRNREFSSGLTMASTVLARWPTAAAHDLLGRELASAGRHDEALAEYRAAAENYPRARYPLGLELADRGRLDEAIVQLQLFIDQEPLLAEVIPARLRIGRAFEAQGKHAEAAAEARQVLAMVPSNLDARLLLAGALVNQRQFDEAIEHYRQYLEARPSDVLALNELGIALSLSEKHDQEAVAVFKRVVAANPRDADTRVNLARALLLNDQAEEAAAEAQAAVALKPDSAANRDLLGRALAELGRFEDARREFERALEIDAADAQAREALTRLSRAQGR